MSKQQKPKLKRVREDQVKRPREEDSSEMNAVGEASSSQKRKVDSGDAAGVEVVPPDAHASAPLDSIASASQAPSASAPSLTGKEYLKSIVKRAREAKEHHAVGGTHMDPTLFANDPIYRIIKQSHRSDVIEILKCKFGPEECSRAATYFAKDFMKGPVRRLRLQMQVGMGNKGMETFLPFLQFHKDSLKVLDLSRNQLNADDVLTLCDALELSTNKSLEVLDLSYNRKIGNEGAFLLFQRLRTNSNIRAVILKSISLDDAGGEMLSTLIWARPLPSKDNSNEALDHFPMAEKDKYNFFVNLNENCIGAIGVKALRRLLPDHVSLTVVKQRIILAKGNRERNQADGNQ